MKCSITNCQNNKAHGDSIFCSTHRKEWRNYIVKKGINHPYLFDDKDLAAFKKAAETP